MLRIKGGKNRFLAVDCISGRTMEHEPGSAVQKVYSVPDHNEDLPFSGPGLIDLQINGVNGIDFNSPSLDQEGLVSAAGYLLSKGVTTFFPTLITNSETNTRHILSVINRACLASPMLERCIGGIHLEGPFISGLKGYRGAHKKRLVRSPDMDLFSSFQKASGNRIRIITLAPECDNSVELITKCRKEGILVSIGHTSASSEQVDAAVKAGASLASHLGNGVPLVLQRHPNILWEILARDALHVSIVADGFHLPESFIRVVLKTKGRKAILVSDATCFSGLSAGIYKSPIGSEVLLEEDGRLSMLHGGGLLAGATRTLIENVQYMVSNDLAGLSRSWYMASAGPGKLAGPKILDKTRTRGRDIVVFSFKEKEILIKEVFQDGKSVWRT
jgi:N-acetylglucosamine-6-phosphate deacetylase